jgi:sugar phosphate permease
MAALFSRATLDACLPAMLADTALGCTPADSAAMLSTGVAFYSVGKLFGGTVSDILGAKETFTATVLNSGVMCLIVSFSSNMRAMGLWWGISRAGGACYWPAMIKLTSSWWDESSFGEAWSLLTTSSRLGAIVGGLTASIVLRLSSWRTIMRIAGLNLCLMGTVELLFLRQGPVTRILPQHSNIAEKREAEKASLEAELNGQPPDQSSLQSTSFVGALCKLLFDKRVFLTFASQSCTLPLLELNSLIPLFLVQSVHVTPSTASTLAIAYPVGAMISMVLSGRAFTKLTDAGRATMFAVQGMLGFIALQILSMPKPSSNGVITCAALAATMLGMAPTIFLAPSTLLTRYSSSRVQGTMAGLVEVPGYVTSMLFLRIYPQILERGGWPLLMRAMQLAVVGGAVCNVVVWRMEASTPTSSPIA